MCISLGFGPGALEGAHKERWLHRKASLALDTEHRICRGWPFGVTGARSPHHRLWPQTKPFVLTQENISHLLEHFQASGMLSQLGLQRGPRGYVYPSKLNSSRVQTPIILSVKLLALAQVILRHGSGVCVAPNPSHQAGWMWLPCSGREGRVIQWAKACPCPMASGLEGRPGHVGHAAAAGASVLLQRRRGQPGSPLQLTPQVWLLTKHAALNT